MNSKTEIHSCYSSDKFTNRALHVWNIVVTLTPVSRPRQEPTTPNAMNNLMLHMRNQKNSARCGLFAALFMLCIHPEATAQTDTLKPRAMLITSKPAISLQAGLLTCLLSTDKGMLGPVFSGAGGVCFTKKVNMHTSILFMLNYQYRYYNGLQTTLYDYSFKAPVNLTTSFGLYEIELPLLVCTDLERLHLGAGFSCSYLLTSFLQQEAIGTYGIYTNAIQAHYNRLPYQHNTVFYKINIAPCANLFYQISKRVGIRYLISFDLLSNPIPGYSFFNSFSFVNNKILITFKL